MRFFEYGEKEMRHLAKADHPLGEIIEKYGIIKRQVISDSFEALAESIIAQQVSGKAAETISGRIKGVIGDITPTAVFEAEESALKNCGLSARKLSYLKSGADFFISRKIDTDNLIKMNDDDIVRLLTQIKGVGIWTAEMLLIFSLERKNILSYNDLGIKKGLMKLHDLTELNKKTFEEFKKCYAPYCSVASFYLWKAAAEK